MAENYHENAQKFIKSSKKLGYKVTAENGELIATPPKAESRASKAFHAATQFGAHLADAAIKKPAKAIARGLTEPSKKYNANREASLKETRRRAESGEFNR